MRSSSVYQLKFTIPCIVSLVLFVTLFVMQGVSHKATQFLGYSIKILILAMTVFLVGKRLAQDTAPILEHTKDNFISIFTYSNIAILLLLSLFNWVFEILKWQALASHCGHISTQESTKHVLKAHITSLITPAKLGEYGAKALFFPIEQRKHILFLTVLGNGYQMLATTIFGVIGIGVCVFQLFPSLKWHYIIALLLGVLTVFMIPQLLAKIRWSVKGYSWKRIRNFIKNIALHTKQKAGFFSFVRYVLFAHQFYFLLVLFGVDITYLLAMGLITTMYLVSSLLPMLQVFDVIVKTGVAVMVFSWIAVPEITIITISFLMWFFNVVLPILPGSYFMMTDTSLTRQKTSVL